MVVSLKYSHGFTRLVPSVVTIAGMLVASGFCLGQRRNCHRNGLCDMDWNWRVGYELLLAFLCSMSL